MILRDSNDRHQDNAPLRSSVGAGKQQVAALKIGVMGGASTNVASAVLEKALRLGRAIARSGCVTITGACPGLPLAAAHGAKLEGGLVVGISPGLSLDEHAFRYESPTLDHDVLIFTGSGLMGREVVNIRSSDMVTIVGGSSGTLGELAIAYDEGKLIGVLTGTGGISDMVRAILDACNKPTGARVLYDDDPERLVDRLLAAYREEHFRRPSVFCRDSAARIQGEGELIPGGQQDPVCGMWVVPDRAAARRHRGDQLVVFCSLQCAERYDANVHGISVESAVASNGRPGGESEAAESVGGDG